MKVTLITHTPNPRAVLAFTKNTRLEMSPGLFDEWALADKHDLDSIQKEIEYISNTIKSSWEFVDMTFMIEGVSRAFTHQFVRNRVGSYAQQTMRVLNVSGFDYITGPSIQTDEQKRIYKQAMDDIQSAYDSLIKAGVKIEDARGILPTNICTNIVVKHNLRSLSDMMASRSSSRTQGEYRDVLDAMYEAVIGQMPWAGDFLRDSKTYALNRIESYVHDVYDGTDKCTHIVKLIDQVRNAK